MLLATLVLACGWCAQGAAAKLVTDQATHKQFSLQPLLTASASPDAVASATRCTTDCTPLLYHGGPVQHAEADYLFFWAPSGYSFPAGYESGLQIWLNGVAAADNAAGNPFSVDTQYYDLSGSGGARSYIPYAVQNAGTVIDADPYPPSGCTDNVTSVSVCLTDAQIQSELSSYTAAHSLPRGINVEYFVLTPQGVGSCFDSSNGECSYTQYCGYHSYTGAGSSQIVYADMPWLYQIPGCDMGVLGGAGHANPGDIDPVVNVFSHELSESMTDPDLNGWVDGSGNEIADKCAWVFSLAGTQLTSGLNWNGSGYWNVPLPGGDYLMQMEFDQRAGYCARGLSDSWTGSAGVTQATAGWSQSGNWTGAIAPGGAVDTLSFPALTAAACTTSPRPATCYTSHNDVSSLQANAITIDDGSGYSIDGNSITLGPGGITAQTAASSPVLSSLSLPVTLGAPQTWTADGGPSGGGGLTLGSTVSGPTDVLQIDVADRAALDLGASDEVGPLTVEGANRNATGASASLNGILTAGSLNATDGNTVSLIDAALVAPGSAAVGSLSSNGGSIQVGQGTPGSLRISGGLTLDTATQLKLLVGPSVPAYSQITASGPVALAGTFDLVPVGGSCPQVPVGGVLTLITTTGPLSGTFSGVPDGQLIACDGGGQGPLLQINYTANSVTATVVAAAPLNVTPPAISAAPTSGSTVDVLHGTWSNAPTAFSYQWERCDASGANCAAIPGATASSYTVGAQDIGDTLRVQETASNSVGAATASSLPSSLVAAAPSASPPPPGVPSTPLPILIPPVPGTGAFGSTAEGSSGVLAPTAAQIKAALAAALGPPSNASRIKYLLEHRGYRVSFKAPGAGTLEISWSLVQPRVSRTRGNREYKTVLTPVSSAHATTTAPRNLRMRIRLNAATRRLLARQAHVQLVASITFVPVGQTAVTVVRKLK